MGGEGVWPNTSLPRGVRGDGVWLCTARGAGLPRLRAGGGDTGGGDTADGPAGAPGDKRGEGAAAPGE